MLPGDYLAKLSPRRFCRCYVGALPEDLWRIGDQVHCRKCSLAIGGLHEARRREREAEKLRREQSRAEELDLTELDEIIELLKSGPEAEGTDQILNPVTHTFGDGVEKHNRRLRLEEELWRRKEAYKVGSERERTEWRRYNRLKFGSEDLYSQKVSPVQYWQE